MARIGMVLPLEGTAAQTIAMARCAEEAGLDSVWMYENLWYQGAFSTTGAIAAATSRIRLGIGTVSPFTRSPAILAMEAGQLHEISGGRFTIGLGASSPKLLDQAGIAAPRPLAMMEETIEVMRRLWTGGVDRFEGTHLKFHDLKLNFDPAGSGPPIYIGAIGSKMLALTGRVADGLIFSILSPLSFVRRALEEVAAGAASANRDPAEIGSVLYIHCALDDDGTSARASLKPDLAHYFKRIAHAANLARFFAEDGLITSEEVDQIVAGLDAGEDPASLVSDSVVDGLCIAGTEDDVRRKVAQFEALGIKDVVMFGIPPDERGRAMVKRLGSIFAPTAGAAVDPAGVSPLARGDRAPGWG
jgi:5,10-methylenetetrahydromethanopterin reductase